MKPLYLLLPLLVASSSLATGGAMFCELAMSDRAEAREVGADTTTRVPVVFSGGHETDRLDGGRPVVLIAAALGVPPEVFREAFTHVHPAPAGTEPTEEQQRANKAALLKALAPYGVTNERLDEVSNYYRYRPQEGELWPTREAVAYALVRKGKIAGFVVTQGGSGYSSAPTVSIRGQDVNVQTKMGWSQTFEENGAVTSVALIGTGK